MEEKKEVQERKQTKEELFMEIFRVLIVSGVATILDWLVAYLFYAWILPPSLIGEVPSLILSTALGFLIGLATNWWLSVNYAFTQAKDSKEAHSKKSFFKFTAIGVIGLLISEAGIMLVPLMDFIKIFGTSELFGASWAWWIMKVTMTLVVFVWNYIARKFFVFNV